MTSRSNTILFLLTRRGREISPAAREATERLMAEIHELEASL